MKNIHLPTIAIVLPCYNEEAALPLSIPVLQDILIRLKSDEKISEASFILCVDDGSSDATWETICALNKQNNDVKGVVLAHNRGHQYALLAGLMSAKDTCDAAISIDADLQDDPEAIVKMVDHFRAGIDIVYGVRQSRETDSWFKRTSARAFYKLQSLMGLQTVYDHADYRLMSKRALDILSEYQEQNLFLRGIVPQIGLSTAIVYYDRNERVAGESKYPLGKMLSFSIDGITSFTAKPMRYIFVLGTILLFIDLFVAIYVLVAYFCGHTVSGWSSIMLSIWFFGSLLLMSVGVVGEYIGKIFVETKHRPRFNIKETTDQSYDSADE
ncbi:MAG: glycosyltransferase family 2 protein [Muribaculaceae bacterium]|nr:glycosyltransferase family 2 protein [Muribaculaceae bacterium]